jgi:hypothetical protein
MVSLKFIGLDRISRGGEVGKEKLSSRLRELAVLELGLCRVG